jgi:hypothetical protein
MLLQAISVMVHEVCGTPVLKALCGIEGSYLRCVIKNLERLKFLVTCNGVGIKSG